MTWQTTLALGLVAVAVAAAWRLLYIAKREDLQREIRENAERKAAAERTKTTADDEAEAIIRRELEKELGRLDDKENR